MKKIGFLKGCLFGVLTGCLLCQGSVFAETQQVGAAMQTGGDVFVEAAEDPSEENPSEENPSEEILSEEIPSEEVLSEEISSEEIPTEKREHPDLSEIFVFIPEELVGSRWSNLVELDTNYDFRCSNVADYNCYVYTADEKGTYCMDLTKTTGRVLGKVYYSEDAVSLRETNAWTGFYDANGFHINLQMEAGMKYVFYIYPDTDREDKGRFRLRKATKEIKSVSASVIANKYLAAGYADDGEWGTDPDGTTNYSRWEFAPARMLDLYKVQITFEDDSTYTWTYANDGYAVGTTNLRINAEQDLEGWTVGEEAYCRIKIGDYADSPRMKIPYTYFTDVQEPQHAYYKAIYWAAAKGITRGYSDNTFGIDRPCTRGEAVMFLWKVMGRPAPTAAAKSPFTDITPSHAFYKAILWASQKGITKGFSDGTFGVDRTCTRGQIMTFIWRAKNHPAPNAVTKSPFSDVNVNHAYYKAILWGSQKGITKGFSDGTFGINRDCTRGQIVTFLYRI